MVSARGTSYKLIFPKTFIPEEIKSKYRDVIHAVPGQLIQDPTEFLNYSVQSFSTPTISYQPIEQEDHPGWVKRYRSVLPLEQGVEHDITISFKVTDGFINYFMMLDIYKWYYGVDDLKYVPSPLIEFMDGQGNCWSKLQLKDMLFIGLSGLDLNSTSNQLDTLTFTASFTCDSAEFITAFNTRTK